MEKLFTIEIKLTRLEIEILNRYTNEMYNVSQIAQLIVENELLNLIKESEANDEIQEESEI